jgi:FSR family fosmidomycin resistance protein-like MFS transporter
MEAIKSEKMNWRALAILSIGHLITDVNQGSLPVLLPFFKDALNLSYTAAGVILLFGNMTSSVIQPAFGYVSDRRPLGWLLPIAPVMACLGMALTGFINNYWLLLISVMFCGMGVASFHPEAFKTASFFTGAKKATGMSLFVVGGNFGSALGPIIALLLVSSFGLKGTAGLLVPGIVMGTVLISNLSWLTAPVRTDFKQKSHGNDAPLTRKEIVPLSLIITIVALRSWTQLGLVSYIPFYYITYLKGDPLYAGKLLTTFLLAGAFGNLVGSPIADRWQYKPFLSLTLILVSPLLFFFYRTQGILSFIIIAALGMVLLSNFGVTVVMAQAILPQRLGMASGLMAGFAIGTGGAAVTLLGTIADHWGVPMALKAILVLPLLAFLLSLFVGYPRQRAAQEA